MEVPFAYDTEGPVRRFKNLCKFYSTYAESYSEDTEMIDKPRYARLLTALCCMKPRALPFSVKFPKYNLKDFRFEYGGDIGTVLFELLRETDSSFLDKITSTGVFFWTRNYYPLEFCFQVSDKSIYFVRVPDKKYLEKRN